MKPLLQGTNVLKVCVSSRPDTFSHFLRDAKASILDSLHANQRQMFRSRELVAGNHLLITEHSPHRQTCPEAVGHSRGDQEEVLVEPGPRGVKSGSTEGACEDFIQKLSSKVHHSGRLLSFDHWPLKQNANHKFIHYYLRAA